MVSEVAYDDVRGEIVNIWRLTYTRKGRPTAEAEEGVRPEAGRVT